MTARLLRYADCVRAHGIPKFPDPVVNSHGIGFSLRGIEASSPQLQSAQRRCGALLPGRQ